MYIENDLNQSQKLCEIADGLNRDPVGVRKEILKHRQLFVRQNAKNKCGLQITCKKTRLCNTCSSGLCKYCRYAKCSTICTDFQEYPNCKSITRFPYVCNGCDKIKECTLPKLFYKAETAHREYKENISNHKRGPSINEAEMKKLNEIITDGVNRGISIEVIIETNNLDIAPSTVYRYIDQSLLTVKNIDLKRKVRYSQRYTTKPKAKPLNYEYLKNRSYEDFASFITNSPTANIWEMDTLVGKKGKGEHTILSLLFTKTNLQLFFKLRSNCSEEVDRVFQNIKSHLGTDIFKQTFEGILTDNGIEFRDPLAIEIDSETGEKLTSIFYCEPRRSDQKGKCEKNHEHFREFIPKGVSFNNYSKFDIHKISNNINNYPRKSLGYNSPYDCTSLLLNKKVLELNRLRKLPTNKIKLKYLKK